MGIDLVTLVVAKQYTDKKVKEADLGGNIDLSGYATEEWVQEGFEKKKLIIQFEQTDYSSYVAQISGQELKMQIESGVEITLIWNEVFYEMTDYQLGVSDSYGELVQATFKKFYAESLTLETIDLHGYLTSYPVSGTVSSVNVGENIPGVVKSVNGQTPDENGNVEIDSDSGIAVTGATVGQTVKISAVDENGVPTEWEAVDFPSDDHINSLIDTKLGVIENGTY